MLELKRLAPEVVAFPRAPRPIRFYFSRPSAIQDVTYLDELWQVFGAANFLGRGLGFLTDRQIAAREFADCRVLVVPHALFVSDDVLAGIRAFVAQGGTLVLIGPRNFERDPWGRERADRQVAGPRVMSLPLASAREHFRRLAPVAAAATPLREVACVGSDGKPAWGVETRTVQVGERTLVYAVNISPEPVAVRVRGAGRMRCLRGQMMEPLPLLRPVLIECRPQ